MNVKLSLGMPDPKFCLKNQITSSLRDHTVVRKAAHNLDKKFVSVEGKLGVGK